MASDSIMAKPTNRVRVIVVEASGCWAREVRAEATARPSPNAGPTQPTAVVSPEIAIDITATRVTLSIYLFFGFQGDWFSRVWVAAAI